METILFIIQKELKTYVTQCHNNTFVTKLIQYDILGSFCILGNMNLLLKLVKKMLFLRQQTTKI